MRLQARKDLGNPAGWRGFCCLGWWVSLLLAVVNSGGERTGKRCLLHLIDRFEQADGDVAI